MRNILMVALVLFLTASLSYGAGFGLYEFGARSSALGGAVVAQGYDASAVFYNPAGIVNLKGAQFYGGLTLLTADVKWVGPTPIFDNTVYQAEKKWHTPIGVYFTYSFSDKFAAGIGVTNPFGLGLEWGDDFPGNPVSQSSDLKSFYISPVISFKLMENLSIGGGVDLVHSTVNLKTHILFPEDSHPGTDVGTAQMEGSSGWALGFSAGLNYTIQKATLGFLYRHQVKNDFDGDASFTFNNDYYQNFFANNAEKAGLINQGVKTSITYPSYFSVGLHYQFTDQLGAELDYMYYKWKVFDVLLLDFEKAEDVEIEEQYKNSYQVRFGLNYAVSPQLELRAGYIYDQTPQPVESMSPLLPDANRNDFAFGLGYKMGNVNLDLAYMLVKFAERSTVVDGKGTNWDGFDGTYSSVAHLFMFSIGVAF